MALRRIGQVLVDQGVLTTEQRDELVEEQKLRGGNVLFGKLGQEMGLLTEEQVSLALAEQFSLPFIDLGETAIPPEVLDLVTDTMAQVYKVIPLTFQDNTLAVALSEPQNLSTVDELRTFLGYDIKAVVATDTDVAQSLERYYNRQESLEEEIQKLANDKELLDAALQLQSGKFDLSREEDLANSAPVRKLLNMILLLAIKDHASDVHFEPFEHEFKIRVKADGVLYEMVPPPRHLANALVTRIKVMSNLDIAERRMPQDGRIELLVGGHPVDLRVAVCPTLFGESVVIRILDRTVVNLDLEVVGMDAKILGEFRQVIRKPNGIVLVTGPTGSGKTTTLYSSLSELNSIKDKIITTEDPVEYDIDGIIQVPIDASINVTFASCLRAILRQDPDIILVGEIRDTETAEIAVQASLTGHLVFSTLHTNDAPSTITRLRDMHIPPFLLSATLEAILAQRLLRRICQDCKEAVVPRSDQLLQLGVKPDDPRARKLYQGRGCDKCNNSGYRGRVGIFELMIINDAIRELIMQNASIDRLRDAAKGYGMTPLREAGLAFMFDGVTTADEVLRETVID